MLTLPDKELRHLRKRFLKPLLAPALAGEPWKPALDAGGSPIEAHVIAASVVSYASRCDVDWANRDTRELLGLVERSAAADCGRFDRDQWPFVHALVNMLHAEEWDVVEPLVARFQQRYRACVSDGEPSGGS